MSQTISGNYTGGVTLSGNPATITRTAVISGTTANTIGVYAPAGTDWTLANAGVVSETGSGSVGISLAGSGTITNTGSIAGGVDSQGSGILLSAGGSVTNQSGGTISGYYGILGQNAPATVTNAGLIAGNMTAGPAIGVYLQAGGAVTNQSGGTIEGYRNGVRITGGAGTVVNLGTIHALLDAFGQQGVYLGGGGSVTNGAAGGTVSAAYIGGYQGGIYSGSSDAVTVTNFGTIAGTPGNTGIILNTGTVINGPSGATGALIYGHNAASGVLIGNAGSVVNYGTIEGGGNTFDSTIYYGVRIGGPGAITNLGTRALIQNYVGVYAELNDTITNAGTIASNHGTAGTALVFGGGTNRLIVDPGAKFIGKVSGSGAVSVAIGGTSTSIGIANGIGSTTLELASAASAGIITGLGTSITNFSALTFDPGAHWTVGGDASDAGLGTLGISGFTFGDTIDLTQFVAVSHTFASNALVLSDLGNTHVTLHVQGAFQTGGFKLVADGHGGTNITVICFASGTLIQTPDGEVQVEKLQAGDLVATAHNGPRPVRWIGHGRVLSAPGRRTAATPVIVCKGALGDNLPHQDLRVTKAHALYVDGVLIPVEFLVNHRSIIWDDRAQALEIYHVELDSHDVLIANGVPAESYRDDGNRWLFHNANPGWEMPPQPPCAPVLTGGPVVDAAWRRFLDRSGPRSLPPMTDDPDLHLMIDGRRVDAAERQGMSVVFRLPGRPGPVHLVSRDAAPAELGLLRDPRSLGVALREVRLRQGSREVVIGAEDPRLVEGFHPYEADCDLRWTNGFAALPVEAFADLDEGPVELAVLLGATTLYADDGSAVRVRRCGLVARAA